MTRIDITVPDKILFETHFFIKEEDINFANHMGNERILVFANTVRTNFYKHLDLLEGDWANGHGTIVANHSVKYITEGFLDDEIICKVGVNELTTCSFDMVMHFIKKETQKTLALVRSAVVYFDYNERRIRELPQSYLDKFL